MAAPGLGIGDLVNACMFIYDMCLKYKDAPKEFDEIAEKTQSTAVVLERIEEEAAIRGNLVDRAGPRGYGRLDAYRSSTDSSQIYSTRRPFERIESRFEEVGIPSYQVRENP